MLDDIRQDVIELAGSVQQALQKANRALLSGDVTAAEEVLAGDGLIDRMEIGIAQQCGRLLTAAHDLKPADLEPDDRREVVAILRVIADLERVGDLAEEIALICRELSPPYPDAIIPRLEKLVDLPWSMLTTAVHAFVNRDLSQLLQLRESEDALDVAQRWLNAEVLRHLRANPADIKEGIGLLFISHNLSRIGDHATNIGELAVYALTGELGRLRNYRPSDYPASLLPLL